MVELEYSISKEISDVITHMLQLFCLAGGRMAGLQDVCMSPFSQLTSFSAGWSGTWTRIIAVDTDRGPVWIHCPDMAVPGLSHLRTLNSKRLSLFSNPV